MDKSMGFSSQKVNRSRQSPTTPAHVRTATYYVSGGRTLAYAMGTPLGVG
jgi:hypothetical protein